MADAEHEVKVTETERGGKKFLYKGYGYVVDRRTPIKVRIRHNLLLFLITQFNLNFFLNLDSS